MELRKDLQHWHVIDLPDGTATPGVADHRREPAYFGIENLDLLKGARVLDVAALDGFWGFWAERQGAGHVLTIDVECYENYDWGYDGPPQIVNTSPNLRKDHVFYQLKEYLNSKVEREHISVYEPTPGKHGEFDLILMYGLMYHLRHPLLALDRMRAVCRGALIVETHVMDCFPPAPIMVFYEDDVLDRSPTNWCGPTDECMTHWMKSAGFKGIYVEVAPKNDRHRFIGTVDPRWDEVFKKNPNFRLCDDAYFREIRETIDPALHRRGQLDMSLYRQGFTRIQKAKSLLRRLQNKISGRK